MDLWTVRDTVTLHFRHQSDTIKLDFALHEKITRVKSTMKTIYRLEGTDGLHSEFLLSSFGKIKKLHNNLSTVIGYCLHIREGSPFLADENIDRLIELI